MTPTGESCWRWTTIPGCRSRCLRSACTWHGGTVHARLERLDAAGVLRANSARVRPEALGRGVAASIQVELDQHQISEAIDALQSVPEVLECFAPAGDTDLLLRVVAKSPDVLYRVAEVVRLCPGIPSAPRRACSFEK